MATGEIDFSQLTQTQLALTDIVAKSNADGDASGTTIQKMANFFSTTSGLEFKGKLMIADTAVEGWYFAGESGDFVIGGTTITVALTNTLTIIIVPSVLANASKLEIPVTVSLEDTTFDVNDNINGASMQLTDSHIISRLDADKDAAPTADSTKSVQSGGIADYLSRKSNLEVISNQFFDKNKEGFIDESYLTSANVVGTNSVYKVTPFIHISKTETIHSNLDIRYTCYFNEYKQVISGGSDTGGIRSFTPTNDTVYVRLTVPTGIYDTLMLNYGTESLPYEDYKTQIASEEISETTKKVKENTSILGNKVDLTPYTNWFDKTNYKENAFMSQTGQIITGNNTYHYFLIEGDIAEKTFTSNYNMRFTCYFDKDDNVILGGLASANSTFTAPADTVKAAITIFQTDLEDFSLEQSEVHSGIYTPFKKVISVDDVGVISKNYDRVNFFNKESNLIQRGYFVSTVDGTLSGGGTNNSYDVTGLIEIPKSVTDIYVSIDLHSAFYDKDGVFISGDAASFTKNVKISKPENAKYFNSSFSKNQEHNFVVASNPIHDIYDYVELPKPKLKLSGFEFNSDDFIYDIKVWLPKEVCVAVGRTIEIYNAQICWTGNIDNYHFVWEGVGNSFDRKWSLTGVSGSIGDYDLTLKVYDANNNLITSETTVVKVVSNVINTPFEVCPIGDSLTNNKPWMLEVESLSVSNISFKGTRGYGTYENYHEGRSGMWASEMLTDFSYGFDATGIDGIDGRTQDRNPFWNPSTSDIDFDYYKSNYTQNPDKIVYWMGTNKIEVDPKDNALAIKTFVDKIRGTGGGSIPIFIIHTLFRGSQNGIANQTNTDGFNTNSSYKLEEDLKVFNLQVELHSLLEDYTDVYLVPVSACHDSEYNFGAVETPVNPRASQTELMPIEATHPQTQGYYQIADVIFSSFCANQ